jgi:DNA ligase-associated metallophosphoesterase
MGLSFSLNGAVAEALPEGALWLKDFGVLILSDLHLEKGASYARRGQMLPPYDTRATLDRLAQVMAQLTPAIVVSLGDSFHERRSAEQLDPADLAQLQALIAMTDWVWILGNHDPAIPEHLAGARADAMPVGPLVLRHEPEAAPAPGEVAGHLHPCAKIAGHGRGVRARCFVTDGSRLVMPAFGAFTGGLNICDSAFAPLFPGRMEAALLAQGGIHPVGQDRLISDA